MDFLWTDWPYFIPSYLARLAEISDGTAIVVPAGAQHNVINVSATDELKLYTIYSPAHHQDGIVMPTKAEAEASTEEFDGKTTE